MSIPVTPRDLHAYVDRALDPARRLEVEAWIAEHPDDAARVQAYRDIEQRLHRQFDRVLTDAGSEGVDPVIAQPAAAAGRSVSPLARTASLVALILLSGVIGWWLGSTGMPRPVTAGLHSDLIRPALFAHQVYATDPLRPVEVSALQRTALNQWVSRRMHTELRAPDLSAHGLTLIGGRLLPSSNRMAAQFMYRKIDGSHRTTLYVRRFSSGGDTDFQYLEQGPLRVFYWVDHAMGYALIGEQPAARLIELAAAVQDAFSQSGSSGPH